MIWREEFNYNGAPNSSIWSYDLGGDGWGNNELQVYTSKTENVVVEDNVLKIIAHKNEADSTFTSARIKTENKFSFTYGTLEASIKPPDLDAGLWPAFWTLGSEFYQVDWPQAGEIDIFEMGQGLAINEGLVNHRVVSAAHWDIAGQYATYAKWYDSPIDLTQDFHTYRMEWTPTKIATYVDDIWIWEIDISDTECPSCQELHSPHHIMLNMAVGGGFTSGGTSNSAAGSSSSSSCAGSSSSAGASSSGGCPSRGPDDITAPLPSVMQVDWIRLYDNGYTVIAPPVPTTSPTNPPVTLEPTGSPRQPESSTSGTGSHQGGRTGESLETSNRQPGTNDGGSTIFTGTTETTTGTPEAKAEVAGIRGADTTTANFLPLDNTEETDETDVQSGPQSLLVMESRTASSSTRPRQFLAMVLSGLVTLGLATGVATRLY